MSLACSLEYYSWPPFFSWALRIFSPWSHLLSPSGQFTVSRLCIQLIGLVAHGVHLIRFIVEYSFWPLKNKGRRGKQKGYLSVNLYKGNSMSAITWHVLYGCNINSRRCWGSLGVESLNLSRNSRGKAGSGNSEGDGYGEQEASLGSTAWAESNTRAMLIPSAVRVYTGCSQFCREDSKFAVEVLRLTALESFSWRNQVNGQKYWSGWPCDPRKWFSLKIAFIIKDILVYPEFQFWIKSPRDGIRKE